MNKLQVPSPYTPKEILNIRGIHRDKIEVLSADKRGKKLGWVLRECPPEKVYGE
jgi:hypothetical protein